jgi:hypothetical protein
MALDVQRYFVFNCPRPGQKIPRKVRDSPYFPQVERLYRGTAAVCASITTIAVDDGRVTIRSGLKNNAEGRAAGEGFCNLIQGSDVADFTPGHKLQDRDGETITVCPARTLPGR